MRDLLAGPLSGRSTAEQRMQNISALMIERGLPWVRGYKPLGNVGAASKARIHAIIEQVRTERVAAREIAPAPRFGAPEPSHGLRLGVMHMRRSPADTYPFALEGGSRRAFKIGWAFDSRRRLREFNKSAMPDLGGIRYRSTITQRWPAAKMAFRMEQSVLACFQSARHVANQEVIVGVPMSEITGAWSEVAAGLAAQFSARPHCDAA